MHRPRVLLAAPLLVLALAGCVPTPTVTPNPGASNTLTPTSSPSPTSTPTVTPTPGPETEPVTIGCSDLIGAQALYDYNPNVSLLTDFAPSAGSLAGQAVAQQGLACRLINQSSGDTIDVGVVRFTAGGFASKMTSVSASSTAASAFDGFFDDTSDGGVAQVFSSPYWVTMTSTTFLESGDAAPLVSAALAGLG